MLITNEAPSKRKPRDLFGQNAVGYCIKSDHLSAQLTVELHSLSLLNLTLTAEI